MNPGLSISRSTPTPEPSERFGAWRLRPDRRRERPRRRAGFTLVEILVATLAFGLLIGAVHAVFVNGNRLRDNATTRTQEARQRARAITLLRRDLRNAFLSGGRLAATLQGDVDGPESRYPGYLKFTTLANPRSTDPRGGEVREVAYYVTEPFDTTNRLGGMLVRTEETNLLAPVREEPSPDPLLAGVEGLELGFFDGEQWLETWDATAQEGETPEAIRVRLLLASPPTAVRPLNPIEIVMPWTVQSLATTSTNSASSTNSTSGSSNGGGATGGGGTGGGATGGGGGGSGTPPPRGNTGGNPGGGTSR